MTRWRYLQFKATMQGECLDYSQQNKTKQENKYFTFSLLVTSQVVFELTRAGVGSEVATETLFVVAAKVLVFDLVDVRQVASAGDIDLVLVD